MLGGYFVFESPDAALLVSLLPTVVHVRGVERLSVLVRLVGDEASERRSGRDLVLTRLVEVLLIDALRSTVTRALEGRSWDIASAHRGDALPDEVGLPARQLQ